MTELPPTSTHHPAASGDGDPLLDPRAPQLLATEHWSLLASRSMSWNEAFSRTGTFLSTLSAATVALALAGPAMSFNADFRLFALVVLGVTLFLGVATFVRLAQVNNEDIYWVYGMNMIRAAYARMLPGIEREFITGHTLDGLGLARSVAAIDLSPGGWLHVFVTTPAIVGVISGAIAGAIGGLLAVDLGTGMAPTLGIGFLVFVVAVALFVAYARREGERAFARLEALRSGDA